MARDTISSLDGSTFVVSDRRGDIDASPGGGSLEILSTDNVDSFSAQFFLYPPTGTIYRIWCRPLADPSGGEPRGVSPAAPR
jgi:hypothetical protein